jgi:hypothetical protein
MKRNMPIVIAVSARLKTGQTLRSIKSITKPYLILSKRFPRAPPRIKPIEHLDNKFLFLNALKFRARKLMTIKENNINIILWPLRIPNAAPVLNVRFR